MLKSKACKKHERLVAKSIAAIIERNNFLNNCSKICPRCGSILLLDAKGCGTCLLQFERSIKRNVK